MSKIFIEPGMSIRFEYIAEESHEKQPSNPNKKPFIVKTQIVAVISHGLVVPEILAHNGLAYIRSEGHSHNTGRYAYIYEVFSGNNLAHYTDREYKITELAVRVHEEYKPLHMHPFIS